ncbi:hypothetical protein ACFSQ0_02440 [Mesonia sediminis]|uniref:Uncharacterized protein n=1 Tax=Mesonia sediminis TaxID=1703946 RepID=A0ABW5SC14_9FLAO
MYVCSRMMTQRVKYSLSWFFLLVFVLVKVASLHSLTHHEHSEDWRDCSWCHIAHADKNPVAEFSSIDFALQAPFESNFPTNFPAYEAPALKPLPSCLIYNKPPPQPTA